MMEYLIIFGLVFIDQFAKVYVKKRLSLYEKKVILKNFLYLYSVRNKGGFLGKMEGKLVFINTFTVIALIIFNYFLLTEGNILTNFNATVGLILLIGGAIGNFIDRIKDKEVVDFLYFQIRGYNSPIFNFADVFLALGMIFIGIYLYF